MSNKPTKFFIGLPCNAGDKTFFLYLPNDMEMAYFIDPTAEPRYAEYTVIRRRDSDIKEARERSGLGGHYAYYKVYK